MERKLSISIILLILLTLISGFTFRLPEIDVPESSIVFDINNRPIHGLAEQNRIGVTLDEISPEFINAVIAVEDKNFYNHRGLDIGGMVRALISNIREQRVVAGGSTITQQTAKNLFLTGERTLTRKLQELIYAFQLEQTYSKDEIMTFYCNTIYFGHGAYGVEVAARTFFGKNAHDINLAEAALLAGLPNWPARYNPYNNPDEAKTRQTVVLNRMLEEEMISEEEMEEALNYELEYKQAEYITGDAPYFIATVRDYLINKFGERKVFQGGLRVYTTLDLDMQKAAELAYYQGMKDRDKNLQAALVALDNSNGHIRALIGGRDYATSTYNRVFSRRQPGSTFKPFVYALAIDSGFTLADKIMCEKVEYTLPNSDVYIPEDFGEKPYHDRKFTLKEALMISDNVIAVKVNHELDENNTAKYTEKFGFKNIKPVLSLPLGSNEVTPIDMVSAYSVFANEGIYSEPKYILEVLDKDGRILYENSTNQNKVISSETAYIITDMMKGVLDPGGTGSHLKDIVQREAAGKTGTTDVYNDAWFVGYTPQLSCAVWVGYDKEQRTYLTGGAAAGPIWADFLREASQKLAVKQFNKPDNIKLINICLDSGLVASEFCPRKSQMAFKIGTEPQETCDNHIPDTEYWEENGLEPDDSEEEDGIRWWQRIFQ
ncbi:Multimodular transpeptidase-transglycosylase [Candidatus Syntrophocurvum alkaliphilum]|uniref:Penicillin-binding protein 1A n=1 Tax=Candidatus Syntrophocurvum alkaliphilum TaxID=2293317 RepID=A0A6I6DD14_9FIRM|nr:PBP1A family penicillin-binding protein [Candidatus Syntrophocurvum alkaliphilum]QGT99234.1 Multimodular transpeptidase-transglycosylase [Candidatus Syntrophocurvum alkaliphilum]